MKLPIYWPAFAAKKTLKAVPAALLILSFTAPVQAQNLYRYTNDQGNPVISGNLPAQYAEQGYEIIDRYGRVVQIVPPKLSPEQQQAIEAHKEQLRKKAAQAQKDADLLALYGNVQEAKDALNRLVEVIEGQIAVILAEANRLNFNLKEKQEQADKLQRSNRAIPEPLSDSIASLEDDIRENRAKHQAKKTELKELRRRFYLDMQRLKTLISAEDRQTTQQPVNELSKALLSGDWRNREELWLDWQLTADGDFRSNSQELGSTIQVEHTGTWQLEGNRLVLMINRKKTTDPLGQISSKRIAQERRVRVLSANERQMIVVLDGKTLQLDRP